MYSAQEAGRTPTPHAHNITTKSTRIIYRHVRSTQIACWKARLDVWVACQILSAVRSTRAVFQREMGRLGSDSCSRSPHHPCSWGQLDAVFSPRPRGESSPLRCIDTCARPHRRTPKEISVEGHPQDAILTIRKGQWKGMDGCGLNNRLRPAACPNGRPLASSFELLRPNTYTHPAHRGDQSAKCSPSPPSIFAQGSRPTVRGSHDCVAPCETGEFGGKTGMGDVLATRAYVGYACMHVCKSD